MAAERPARAHSSRRVEGSAARNGLLGINLGQHHHILCDHAEQTGRVAPDIPVNHSATFAPLLQPTLDTGTQALVVAALAWLGR